MSRKLIIIILIILILILVCVLFLVEDNDSEPIYRYEDIKKKLKTGDIILFSCKKHGSFINKIIYACRTNIVGSQYGHAGIIIKDPQGKLYIVESCDHNQCSGQHAHHLNKHKKGGVRIIDTDIILKEYYKKYEGIYAVKFISSEIPYEKFMEKLNKYKNIIFQNRDTLSLLVITDLIISHTLATKIANKCDNNEMICTEFLHSLLYDCKVLKDYPSKIFWPHLITSKIFDDLENVKYSKPYKFIVTNDHH